MSNNIKTLFWLFKAKTNKNGEAPIMLRVSYQSERKQISKKLEVKYMYKDVEYNQAVDEGEWISFP